MDGRVDSNRYHRWLHQQRLAASLRQPITAQIDIPLFGNKRKGIARG